jgi:hypothetical protein
MIHGTQKIFGLGKSFKGPSIKKFKNLPKANFMNVKSVGKNVCSSAYTPNDYFYWEHESN